MKTPTCTSFITLAVHVHSISQYNQMYKELTHIPVLPFLLHPCPFFQAMLCAGNRILVPETIHSSLLNSAINMESLPYKHKT